MASILVVGGGLAGLVCASRLLRAGHEVELIEAEPGVGGRLRPIETDSGILERGLGEVGWGDANLRALVAGLGLESTHDGELERSHALVLGGRLHRPPPLRMAELVWPGLAPRMDRPIDAVFRRPPRWADRKSLISALYATFRQSGSRPPVSVQALDDLTWSKASIRAFGTRWCTTRMAPALLARTGVDLAAESAAIVVPVLCRLLSGAGRSIPVQGGMARVVESLGAPLRTRLGCRVENLEATTDGVRIRYRAGGRVGVGLADAAVLALPPREILRLCPKLTPIERGHFESIHARRSIAVYRQISEPAWLLRGLSGVTFVPGELPNMRDIRVLGSSPLRYASDPFWVRIAFEPEVVDAHWHESDQALIQKVDSTFRGSPLGKLPQGPSRVERLEEIVSVQGRGALARRERFEGRSERTPRLVYATQALTTPDLEGRVTAGMRAAREIAEEVDAWRQEPARVGG
jgi:Flavin containing amine oxidoreductase